MSSRSIRLVTNDMNFFPFKAEWHPLYMYSRHSLSIYLLVDAQIDSILGYCEFFCSEHDSKTTLINRGCRHTALTCFEWRSSSGTSRAYGGSIFNFWDNCHKSFSTVTALSSKLFLCSFIIYFIHISLDKYSLSFYNISEVLFEMLSE